jgi:hypothetical protein
MEYACAQQGLYHICQLILQICKTEVSTVKWLPVSIQILCEQKILTAWVQPMDFEVSNYPRSGPVLILWRNAPEQKVKQKNINLPKMLLLLLLHVNRWHSQNSLKTKTHPNKAQLGTTMCQFLNESFKIPRFR